MGLQIRRAVLLLVFLVASIPLTTTAAQTPVPMLPGGEWWTAWSSCEITPVQYGPAPENIPGTPDAFYWLQAETTKSPTSK